jgi:AraC-like DNA-binding protein
MKPNYIIEDETVRSELQRRGFEFYRYLDLPQNCPAADLHVHDAIEFIYVVEGSISATVDEFEEYLEKGDLVLFRSQGVHSIKTNEKSINKYYILKISTTLLQSILPKDMAASILFRFCVYNGNLKRVWRKNEILGTEIMKSLDAMINNCELGGKFVDISIFGNLIGFIYGILQSVEQEMDKLSPKFSNVYESITYINSNYDSDLTAESVAALINVSYSSFSRMFKKATGKTFKEYLNITRIYEAERLLKTTDYPVADIAIRCGYNNVSYFTATYKRYKGITPRSAR